MVTGVAVLICIVLSDFRYIYEHVLDVNSVCAYPVGVVWSSGPDTLNARSSNNMWKKFEHYCHTVGKIEKVTRGKQIGILL